MHRLPVGAHVMLCRVPEFHLNHALPAMPCFSFENDVMVIADVLLRTLLSPYIRVGVAQGGQPVSCPLRCAPPERVVANSTVRALVALAQAAPHPGCGV